MEQWSVGVLRYFKLYPAAVQFKGAERAETIGRRFIALGPILPQKPDRLSKNPREDRPFWRYTTP